MYCKKCGQEIGEDVKFCPRCGNAISGKKESRKTKKIELVSIILLVCIAVVAEISLLFESDKMNETKKTKEILFPYTDAVGHSEISYSYLGLGKLVNTDGEPVYGKYGYMNQDGELIIPMKFDIACWFKNGRACVGIDDKYGYIDENGKEVIAPIYDWASDFSENGTAFVELNKKCYQIDKNGEYLKVLDYTFFKGWHNWELEQERYVVEKEDGKQGIVDNNAQEIIALEYDIAWPCKNGAIVGIDEDDGYFEKWYFINEEGSTIELEWARKTRLWPYGEKLLVWKGYDFSLVDYNGIEGIRLGKYGFIFPSTDKAVLVDNGEYFGVVSNKDELITPFEFDEGGEYIYGMAMVMKDDKVGFVNDKGEQIIDCIYDYDPAYISSSSWGFNSDGYAAVYREGHLLYVDKQGNEITLKSR